MRSRDPAQIAEHVSKCLQLALLLEVSSQKPGNVHRSADFKDTRYEHFLASAVAVAPYFKRAAERGVAASRGYIDLKDVGIGELIRDAVENVMKWQHGGNTLLGATTLLSLIAVAAGMTYATDNFSLDKLRKNIGLTVKSTTPADAASFYEAIDIAKPGGMGRVPEFDVTDPSSKRRVLEKQVSLYEVFKIASEYDSIAYEWVNNYPITFDIGHPFFVSQLGETDNLNVAIVHTFLKILSEVPDTLIQRKVGREKAAEVSKYAKRILDLGGLKTPQGRKMLSDFDELLRDPEHKLNPGTTADIVSAVLAISILDGYRP